MYKNTNVLVCFCVTKPYKFFSGYHPWLAKVLPWVSPPGWQKFFPGYHLPSWQQFLPEYHPTAGKSSYLGITPRLAKVLPWVSPPVWQKFFPGYHPSGIQHKSSVCGHMGLHAFVRYDTHWHHGSQGEGWGGGRGWGLEVKIRECNLNLILSTLRLILLILRAYITDLSGFLNLI